MVLLTCGLGGWMFWSTWQKNNRTQQLELLGVSADATVTDLNIRRVGSYRSSYRVCELSYHAELKNTAGAVVVDRTSTVSRQTYDLLTIGSKVTVYYLPSDPSGTIQLSSEYSNKNSGLWGGVFIIITGVVLFLSMAGRGKGPTIPIDPGDVEF